MKLHLGVIDLNYGSDGKTTGDVASILEAKYHLIEAFSEVREIDIADMLADGMAGALETAMMGQAVVDPFASGTSGIEDMFKSMLTEKSFDDLLDGVPTQAARNGIDHRKKSKKGKKGRPSFIDTGLFQSSFKVWVSGQVDLSPTLFSAYGEGFTNLEVY